MNRKQFFGAITGLLIAPFVRAEKEEITLRDKDYKNPITPKMIEEYVKQEIEKSRILTIRDFKFTASGSDLIRNINRK